MTNAKKLLAMLITVLMVLSSAGTFALAAETVELEAVHVIQGQNYTLPTTIGEYTDIAWDSAVSTDYVGVQKITGEAEETPLSITVHVGELTNHKVTENFESFSEDATATKVGSTTYSSSSSTIVFNMDSNNVEDDFSVVTVDGDRAIKFGEKYSGWQSRIQQLKNVESNKPQKFTFNLKIELDKENVNNNKLVGQIRIHDLTSTGKVFVQLGLYTNEDSSEINLQPTTTAGSDATPMVKIADVDAATSATKWLKFEAEIFSDDTYDLYVDGVKVVDNMAFYNTSLSSNTPGGIAVQNYVNPNTDYAPTNIHYLDDITVYGANYVTGVLPASLEGVAYTDTDGTGEATANLAMTSGTKDFTVKYTVPAEDLVAGTTTTVQGEIDGFTHKIPVNVTVKATDSKNTTIKTSQNGVVTLPATYNDLPITWDKAVDTSKVGTIVYNGTTTKDTGITCTVIVGDYTAKQDDVISKLKVDFVDSAAEKQVECAPSDSDARLVVPTSDNDNVQVTTVDGENVVKYGPGKVGYNCFIGPQEGKSGKFSGNAYKVSAEIKIEKLDLSLITKKTQIFTLRTKNIKEAANVLVYVDTDGKLSFKASGETAAESDEEVVTNINVENMVSPWFNVTFFFYEDLTYDMFVENQLITSRCSFYWNDKTLYTKLTFDRFILSDALADNGVQYVKNFEFGTYRYFDGTLPTSFDLTLGHNLPINEKTTLTMSDNTEREFKILTGDIDGTKVGQFSVNGSIEGFDTPVAINARVCDYLIKEVDETSAGINTATIQKIGAATSGVAVFAYYGSDHKLAKVKSVPFTDSNFTDGVAKLNVGLEFPTDVTGGYVKGFIFNSLSGIIPLDVVFN